jgi:50S ribosomal protein L16 3-hydroxylase
MKSPRTKASKPTAAHVPLDLLGGISAHVFLRDYWQKKPLLIRNAISEFVAPLSKKEVFTLARRHDAESRLITRDARQWQLNHGPFSAKDFRLPVGVEWTVLIQDVQHFSYEAHDLLAKFNFIPQARIDDLMVSYAVAGAGVGPHFDSYDVFLLQGNGRRRWQISQQKDLRLQPDLPLKILSHFKPTQEFILDAGDMLYLPPSVAHNGIAETECMTWSVGFRAPSQQDLSVSFLDYLRDSISPTGLYADPNIAPSQHCAEIDAAMQRRLAELLNDVQSAASDPAIMRKFIGCYLTEPKAHIVFDAPEEPISAQGFESLVAQHGLELDLKTRMLYDNTHVFVNGEACAEIRGSRRLLRELANQRKLAAVKCAGLRSGALGTWFYQCYRDGILGVARH